MTQINNDIKINQNKLMKLKDALNSNDADEKMKIAVEVGKTNLRYIKEYGLDNILKRLIEKQLCRISNLIIIKDIIENFKKQNRPLNELINTKEISKKCICDYLEKYIKKCMKCGVEVKRTTFYKNEFLCRNCLCPSENSDSLLISVVENLHVMHCGRFTKH